MFAVPKYTDTTNFGQIILFLTFLVNTIVQLWRERQSRLAREKNKREMEARDAVLKQTLKQHADEINAAMINRVQDIHKRLDALLNNGGQ